MKDKRYYYIIAVAISFLLLLISSTSLVYSTHHIATSLSLQNQSQLAQELIGTWVLIGTPESPSRSPTTGRRLHFFTGRHWLITEMDAFGEVMFHHGGTYILNGDELAKTVEYANKNTFDRVGKTKLFKIKVEYHTCIENNTGNPLAKIWWQVAQFFKAKGNEKSDTYIQIGIDNPFSEIWQRVE